MKIPDFILFAPILDISGTAEAARNLYLAFFDLGIRVKLQEVPNWSHLKADLTPDVREKIQIGFERNDVQQPVVIHFYPPHHMLPMGGPPQFQGSAFNVSYTVFETDKAPILWRDILNSNMFVENWVGAPFNIEAYSSIGIDKNKLRCIPHGVDTERFNPNVEPLKIDGKKEFAFITALDWSVRKNPEAMLAAFMQEFTNDPDVCLVIKAYTGYGDENSKNKIRQDIHKFRAMTRSKANVLFIPDFLSSDIMPNFHKAGNVWVNLSRGEGFDMGAMQSMACGVPVVGTDNTAHQMYLNESNGYPVQNSKVAITNQEFLARSPQFIGHSWWEANIKNARFRMRESYNDWKSGKLEEKSKNARQEALDHKWQITALSMIFNAGKYFQVQQQGA